MQMKLIFPSAETETSTQEQHKHFNSQSTTQSTSVISYFPFRAIKSAMTSTPRNEICRYNETEFKYV